MNARERVIAQIEHQETETIPYVLPFEANYGIEERLDAYYGSNHWYSLLDHAIVALPSIGQTVWVQDPGASNQWTDVYGSTWRLEPRPRSVIKPALTAPTFDGYDLPTAEACFDPDWEKRARAKIVAHPDRFLVASFGAGLFERSWMIRGFEEALIDAALNPDFYEELIERLTDHFSELIDRLVKLPIDGVFFSDDWGYQQGILIGAARWRRIFKPRYERLYYQVHEAGKYVLSHCCGGIREILPDAIEIGLDVYESVQPEARNNNPYELKRDFGDKITFMGGLGSQSAIPFGKPAEIRTEVRRLCKDMGRGGGYILAPAKPVQPETPDENLAALVEAFLEQSGMKFP